MSKSLGNGCLSVAALGRPFQLGGLYDCRTDKIVSGITLWDKSTLSERSVQYLGTAQYEIIASDTLNDKSLALDINAGLKLSCMGGLIDLSGSGRFLINRKTSARVERVTLKYECTTKSEEMTMEQLGKGKIQHPEVFDHGTATHVVTGITYGGKAFFVFDRAMSSSSAGQDVSGHLSCLIGLIPKIVGIGGEGNVGLSDKEKEEVQNFTCRYFGDFKPTENPSSFGEAVKLYRDLPNLIGKDGEKAVPVEVHLYPLALLDSKASKLVREISIQLVRDTEKTLEDIHEFDIKCNDLLQCEAVQKFRRMKTEIKEFQSSLLTYKLGFQRKLSQLLPPIKGGGKEESELADLLKEKESSPFSLNALSSWLEMKEGQLRILSEYTSSLSQIKFASKVGDLEAMVMSPKYSNILCFSVIMPKQSYYLSQMSTYLSEERLKDTVNNVSTLKSEQSWMLSLYFVFVSIFLYLGKLLNLTSFYSSATNEPPQLNSLEMPKTVASSKGNDNYLSKSLEEKYAMMEKARLFQSFFESNRRNSSTCFIVGEEISDSKDFQAKVRYFKEGKLLDKDFEIVGPPLNVAVPSENITHDSMIVKWSKPSHGTSNISGCELTCWNVTRDKKKILHSDDICCDCFFITGLEPGCAYQLSIHSICEVGISIENDACEPVNTKPSSPPGKPVISQTSLSSIEIKWARPSIISSHYTNLKYVVKQQNNGSAWYEANSESTEVPHLNLNVDPNVTYNFKVVCDCGQLGMSLESEVSDDFVLNVTPEDNLKKNIIGNSTLLKDGNPCIYKLDLKRKYFNDKKKFEKFEFGYERHGVQEKRILLVGSTGSGKTTLINGIMNYVFAVDWKDNFRIKLITEPYNHNQAKCQSSKMSSYTIHHQEGFRVPYTLTIIDTPGFSGVQDIARDKEITEQIRSFFTSLGPEGIDHIDAVGFVANASHSRLTVTQRYIFDQMLSLFGKDIQENIFLLLTFADGQDPQLLSDIKEANIHYKNSFEFNNSALFVGSQNTLRGKFNEMFWQMGEESFKDFMNELNMTKTKSLTLTKDVLNERNQLELSVSSLNMDIQSELNKLEQLKTVIENLMSHQSDIDRNKHFKYTVNEEIVEKIELPVGTYATCCLQCNRTCHADCDYGDDEDKKNCSFIRHEHCIVCSCHWSIHKNVQYKFVSKWVKKTRTLEDLRKRYEEATKKKLSAEEVVENIQDEFKAVQIKVLGMTEAIRKSLKRLNEIALKPNPLSTVEYIDILIKSETDQARPGWQARTAQLQKVRKEAEYMKKVADQGFDPFEDYKRRLEQDTKENKGGWRKETSKYFHSFRQ